ncbi:hypothetical protein GCM10027168_55790 [Streptomyces capparidis]
MGNRGKPRHGRARPPAPPPGPAEDAGPPPGPRLKGGRAERRRVAKRVKRRRRRSLAKELPILLGAALLIALLLKTFLLQAFSIPSGSMENTIRVGDRVVVDKLTPWFGAKPSRGDVVVFKDPGGWLEGQPRPKEDPPGVKQVKSFFTFIGLLPSADEQDLIKRVVAVGGDTVECCDAGGRVTVNGFALNESYVRAGNEPSAIPFRVRVPPGRLFVMGDHRANSADSRLHLDEPGQGTISEDLVVGRAFAIAWPTSHWRSLSEPEIYASVPDRDGATTAIGPANHPRESTVPPVPVELPIVMTVMGALTRRGAARSAGRDALGGRGATSGRRCCGGPGGRRTVRVGRAGGQGHPGRSGRQRDQRDDRGVRHGGRPAHGGREREHRAAPPRGHPRPR